MANRRNQPPPPPKKTALTVFVLVPGKDDKTYWNRSGVAFENRDGSLNVKLDLFPDVTFQIREPNGDNGDTDRRGG